MKQIYCKFVQNVTKWTMINLFVAIFSGYRNVINVCSVCAWSGSLLTAEVWLWCGDLLLDSCFVFHKATRVCRFSEWNSSLSREVDKHVWMSDGWGVLVGFLLSCGTVTHPLTAKSLDTHTPKRVRSQSQSPVGEDMITETHALLRPHTVNRLKCCSAAAAHSPCLVRLVKCKALWHCPAQRCFLARRSPVKRQRATGMKTRISSWSANHSWKPLNGGFAL